MTLFSVDVLHVKVLRKSAVPPELQSCSHFSPELKRGAIITTPLRG